MIRAAVSAKPRDLLLLGVTVLTILSVLWAERIVATRSSSGLE